MTRVGNQAHEGGAVASEQDIADEWATKSAHTATLDAWRVLWREAKHHGYLPYVTTSGEVLEYVLRDRGEALSAEQAQDAAGEPEPAPDGDYTLEELV